MKTIALTCILKNEIGNLERFCQSVQGCFDQYIFVDTGSTDGSIEFLNFRAREILGPNVIVGHFGWIDDFSAARNWAQSFVETDYWMWADLDDSLSSKSAFLTWKRSTMEIADVWFAPYWYAISEDRKPLINFVRERVFKTSLGCQFQDFVHEGVKFPEGAKTSGVMGWHIIHERTETEMLADKGRNLSILEKNKDNLTTRLKFYLGKEYFDNGRHKEASEALVQALQKEDLNLGDRILGIQYLCQSLYALRDFVHCIKYGLIGVNLDPTRAEYYCFIGDSYVASNELEKAIPMYRAALGCANKSNGLTHEFSFGECYDKHPKTNLSKIYFNTGRFDQSLEVLNGIDSQEATDIRNAIANVKLDSDISEALVCEDIVITCPMPPAYPWDEEVYKTKGLGGSETAAVEMAKWLRKLTGRQVKVFQERLTTMVAESGVEYIPVSSMMAYFRKWSPKIHIAWRHNIKLTNAPTYVWCHDLIFDGLRQTENYEKILALSPFHKDFLQSMLGLPEDKFMITRNGINPERFKPLKFQKEYGKVVWTQSPDRGLEHAIAIMDLVREEIPGASLHVFYGMDNLRKYGLSEKANELQALIDARPWIKYHGNVSQDILVNEVSSAEVWIYPSIFIETFSISCLESLLCKVWPVVRKIGALQDTLRDADNAGMCDLIDVDPTEYSTYAAYVIDAIESKKYLDIDLNPDDFGWEGVAREWIKTFEL